MTKASTAEALAGSILLFTLGGCAASMSGVGGTDAYACKAPQGAMCTSISGVYANTRDGVRAPTRAADTHPAPTTYGAHPVPTKTIAASTSDGIRSHPRVLRLWIAPWEDADGDLHEAAYVHLVVDPGRWLIEHVRPAQRTRIDVIKPPIAVSQEASPSKPPEGATPEAARFPVTPKSTPSATDPRPGH